MRVPAVAAGVALLLAAAAPAQTGRVAIPARSVVVVRMLDGVSSDSSLPGDTFSAAVQSVTGPLDNAIALPWPVTLTGHVVAATSSGEPDAVARLTIHFDRLWVEGRGTAIQASLVTYVPVGDAWRITTVDGGAVIIDRMRFDPPLRGVLLERSGGTAFAGVARRPAGTLVAPAPGHVMTLRAGTVFAIRLETPATLPPRR